MVNKINIILAVLATIVSTLGVAESRYQQVVLVTDIKEKAAMGFNPEEVLYKLQNVNSSSKNDLADYEYIEGVSSIKRVGYLGVESQGRTSNFQYGTGSGLGDIHRSAGIDAFTDILLELDDNSDFNFVRIWGSDTNVAEDMAFFLFERCLPEFSGGFVTSTTLGTTTSSTSAGNFSVLINIAADAITVNNSACTYSLRTRFDTTDNTLRLYKVRAEFVVVI